MLFPAGADEDDIHTMRIEGFAWQKCDAVICIIGSSIIANRKDVSVSFASRNKTSRRHSRDRN
jgi:hypothetical protein